MRAMAYSYEINEGNHETKGLSYETKDLSYEIKEGNYECKGEIFEVKERHLRRRLFLLRLI